MMDLHTQVLYTTLAAYACREANESCSWKVFSTREFFHSEGISKRGSPLMKTLTLIMFIALLDLTTPTQAGMCQLADTLFHCSFTEEVSTCLGTLSHCLRFLTSNIKTTSSWRNLINVPHPWKNPLNRFNHSRTRFVECSSELLWPLSITRL